MLQFGVIKEFRFLRRVVNKPISTVMKTTKLTQELQASRMVRREISARAKPETYTGTIALICIWLMLMITYWIW